MKRVFDKDKITEIIDEDRQIMKKLIDYINDSKKLASDVSNSLQGQGVSEDANISGAVAKINKLSSQDVDDIDTKFYHAKGTLDEIMQTDADYATKLAELCAAQMALGKVIDELKSFISTHSLMADKGDFDKAMEAKQKQWTKELKATKRVIDDSLKNIKGASKKVATFSKDPVNLSSGNFIYQKTDLYYGADEDDGDLVFSRFYNSINDFEGILGKDWNTNFEVCLKFEKDEITPDDIDVVVFKEDGQEEKFMPLKDGYYTAGRESTASLYKLEGEKYNYKYETLAGDVYYFSKEGKLLRQEDLNRVGISFNCAIMGCIRCNLKYLNEDKEHFVEKLLIRHLQMIILQKPENTVQKKEQLQPVFQK